MIYNPSLTIFGAPNLKNANSIDAHINDELKYFNLPSIETIKATLNITLNQKLEKIYTSSLTGNIKKLEFGSNPRSKPISNQLAEISASFKIEGSEEFFEITMNNIYSIGECAIKKSPKLKTIAFKNFPTIKTIAALQEYCHYSDDFLEIKISSSLQSIFSSKTLEFLIY